jgi:hypothetical protein
MNSTRLVIQLLHSRWTKSSRGGDGAVARAELPLALPLLLDSFAAPVTLHTVRFWERDNFVPTDGVARFDTISGLPIRDLTLQRTADGVSVVHTRDQLNAAIADRLYNDEFGNTVYDIDAFSLVDGEWGQIQYNGRYTCIDSGRWWYEQSVYNIGLFTDIDATRFTDTDPAHRFVELATLH